MGLKEAMANGIVSGSMDNFLIDFKNRYLEVSAEVFWRVKEDGILEVRFGKGGKDILRGDFEILTIASSFYNVQKGKL